MCFSVSVCVLVFEQPATEGALFPIEGRQEPQACVLLGVLVCVYMHMHVCFVCEQFGTKKQRCFREKVASPLNRLAKLVPIIDE